MTEQEELAQLRQNIDQLDQQIQALINQRALCAQQVAEVKQKYAKPGEIPVFYRPEREAQILRRVMQNNPGPVPDAVMAGLIREVMSVCLSLEQPLDIACVQSDQGHGHQAAARHFGQSARLKHYESDDAALVALMSQSVDYSVIDSCSPIWSGLLDATSSGKSDLWPTDVSKGRSPSICGEMVLPTEVGSSDSETSAVLTTELAPKLTGTSLTEVFNQGESASVDQRERFWVIGTTPTEASGLDLTSLLVRWPEDESGTILQCLDQLLDVGGLKIVSARRLVTDDAARAGVIVDLDGHVSEPSIADFLSSMNQAEVDYLCLGSYPVAAF